MLKQDFAAAAMLSVSLADKWYEPVERAMMEFAIVSPMRAAAFIAQIGHESGGFQDTREIWGPTPAQERYEGRQDLGNVNPGDGKKYMGRGLIQITGRANYAAVALGLGLDVLSNPGLLERPILAARSAGWWWSRNGCNEIADSGDFEALTRRINGGLNGYPDRLHRYNIARAVLGA
ncbi:glycoside hydrolase family 19 protein [Bordetella flabilis]|uniref:Chitinase n=1 Tax=Bordetella flabilis TaxID=463014 RepID=A0A193GGF6_9BORD|nr:glycoside hydrolase family 19 protein [Bordetella flabilis]ANN78900.1 chitinase [Bordetella flabilis]